MPLQTESESARTSDTDHSTPGDTDPHFAAPNRDCGKPAGFPCWPDSVKCAKRLEESLDRFEIVDVPADLERSQFDSILRTTQCDLDFKTVIVEAAQEPEQSR